MTYLQTFICYKVKPSWWETDKQYKLTFVTTTVDPQVKWPPSEAVGVDGLSWEGDERLLALLVPQLEGVIQSLGKVDFFSSRTRDAVAVAADTGSSMDGDAVQRKPHRRYV